MANTHFLLVIVVAVFSVVAADFKSGIIAKHNQYRQAEGKGLGNVVSRFVIHLPYLGFSTFQT